ncbi:hypothetical protein ElyMa_004005300 [Elysia marginata]|uniref:Uncharacterized protein n=1 Tax=Elysia marginata TaxID=1093978 RepID=A0AAV4G0K0_9GAST|nr:hypothetical protein ElyMa_004005300 [Elysia marginata]
MLPWAYRSKSVLSTNRRTRYPGLSGLRAFCLPLTITIPWVFWSKSLLSTIRPTRYPGPSSPRVYCLLLNRHIPWAFRSKSLLSTASANQHATLGLPVQEATFNHKTNKLH